ncbi:MAG: hypothetical protein AAGK04_03450, partial [Planctomycetota bacterium]
MPKPTPPPHAPTPLPPTSHSLNPPPEMPRQTMRALVKHHAGEGLRMDRERPMPHLDPHDCLIRVHKAGICGTDRHIWE